MGWLVSTSTDGRVRMFNLLMLPAFYAHSLQLMREDKPWLDDAFIKYWTTPGWHLYLSPWFILALAAAMD